MLSLRPGTKCLSIYIFFGGVWVGVVGVQRKGNENIRSFLSGLNTQPANKYSADTQHTACTNTEYHALYLTGDPRTCSFRCHSAGWSKFSKTILRFLWVPKTLLWSTWSRPHWCKVYRGHISRRSRRCKTHPWYSCCSCTHSPATVAPGITVGTRLRWCKPLKLDIFQEDVGTNCIVLYRLEVWK